jgi:hypothetical protein
LTTGAPVLRDTVRICDILDAEGVNTSVGRFRLFLWKTCTLSMFKRILAVAL